MPLEPRPHLTAECMSFAGPHLNQACHIYVEILIPSGNYYKVQNVRGLISGTDFAIAEVDIW